jgi:hypothetical protein
LLISPVHVHVISKEWLCVTPEAEVGEVTVISGSGLSAETEKITPRELRAIELASKITIAIKRIRTTGLGTTLLTRRWYDYSTYKRVVEVMFEGSRLRSNEA